MFYHAACCCGAAPQDWLLLGGDSGSSKHWYRLDPSDLNTLTETVALSDGAIEDVDYGPDLAGYTAGTTASRRLLVTAWSKAIAAVFCKVNSLNDVYMRSASDTLTSYDSGGTQVDTKTWGGHTVKCVRICSDDDVIVALDKTATSDLIIKRLSTDMATERWSTSVTGSNYSEPRVDLDEDDHAYMFFYDVTATQAILRKYHENTGAQQWTTNIGATGFPPANSVNAVAARNGSVYCVTSSAKPVRCLTSTGVVQWTSSISGLTVTAGRDGACYTHTGGSGIIYKLKVSDGTADVTSSAHSGADFENCFMAFDF